jgi:hypothetical protein
MSLEAKHEDLLVERGKQERLAVSITDQMYVEAQVIIHWKFIIRYSIMCLLGSVHGLIIKK